MFFILIPQNIVLFSQTKWNVGFKAVLFRQKTRKFLQFNKSKIFTDEENVCFKRAIFCIIQRKVKRMCILLIQIFNFLLRWLLTLVKVHIMLCTFNNETIKSLILTLNMFKRFLFFYFLFFFFDVVPRTVMQKLCKVWRPMLQKFFTVWRLLLQKFCKVRRQMLQKFCMVLRPMMQKFCKVWRSILQKFYTPWRLVLQKFCTPWRSVLQKFCTPWRPVRQKFYTPWRPVLQNFCTPWRPVLQKFCTVWRPQQQKFCRQWHPELNKFYVLRGSMLQKFWVVAFPFSKRQIVQGLRIPTVSISFLLCFFYFSVIIFEITILCLLMSFEWQDKLVKTVPRLETKGY